MCLVVHWQNLGELIGTDVRDGMDFAQGVGFACYGVGEGIPDKCLSKTVGFLSDLRNLA